MALLNSLTQDLANPSVLIPVPASYININVKNQPLEKDYTVFDEFGDEVELDDSGVDSDEYKPRGAFPKEKFYLFKLAREEYKIDLRNDVFKDKILAGGAINSIFTHQKINDLDFYSKKSDGNNDLYLYLVNAGYSVLAETDNATTMVKNTNDKEKRKVIQIITDPELNGHDAYSLIDTFDFTIVQAAFDFESDDFVFGNRFFIDCTARVLNYNVGSRSPLASVFRAEKFKKRGYTISTTEMLKILLTSNTKTIYNNNDLVKQISNINGVEIKNYISTINTNQNFVLNDFVEQMDNMSTTIYKNMKPHSNEFEISSY